MEKTLLEFEKKMSIKLPGKGVSYKLTSERLIITKASVIGSGDAIHIDLEDIKDYNLVKRTMSDKVRNIGDIQLITNDPSTPEYLIDDVENVNEVYETLRSAIKDRTAAIRRSNNTHFNGHNTNF